MKGRAIGLSGCVVVSVGMAATALFCAMARGIWRPDWFPLAQLDAAAIGIAAICLIGCALGWCSFRTRPGRAAAIIGTLLILFWLFEFLRSMAMSGMVPPSEPNDGSTSYVSPQ